MALFLFDFCGFLRLLRLILLYFASLDFTLLFFSLLKIALLDFALFCFDTMLYLKPFINVS